MTLQRIIWLSHEAGLEGAELCLLEGVKGMLARGYHVHVVLPWRKGLEARLERLPVPVHTVPYTWWMGAGARRSLRYRIRRLGRNLLAWRALVDLIRRTQPDLVVSNTVTIPLGAVASRYLGIPHVWYVHELFGEEGHGLFFDFGSSLSLSLIDRLSDRIIVNSRAVQRQFQERIPPEKISLVYGSVEVPLQGDPTGRADTSFRLCTVGRIAPAKRQEDAIRAVALLAAKRLDVRLTLIGREFPEYGSHLRELARELAVQERVEFVGFSHAPCSLVGQSDLALICSRGEAFGRVTVEAMQLGKAVVGADSGGTPELIRHGWNGFLYRLGDAEDLARHIEILYHDRTLLQAMGSNALEWSTRTFSVENYTSALLDVFNEVFRCRAEQGSEATSPPHRARR
jgi:glycosyltransferase involved in cell wall biosynthesis